MLAICLLLSIASTIHAQSPLTPHEAKQLFAHVQVLNCGDGGLKACRISRHDVPPSLAAKLRELEGVIRVSQVYRVPFYVAEEQFGLESFVPNQLTIGSSEYIASRTGLSEETISSILGGNGNKVIITESVSRRFKLGVGDELQARLLHREGEAVTVRVGYIRKFGQSEVERFKLYMLSDQRRSLAARQRVATELEIELDNPDDLNNAVKRLRKTIGDKLVVRTWHDHMVALNALQSN